MKANKVLVLGDLHIDDANPPRFVDYWATCVDAMNRILKLKKEHEADLVILAGDFIGLRQSAKFKDLRNFATVMKFLKMLDNVVIVKGNHDYADGSAFDVLHDLGLFKTSSDVGGQIMIPTSLYKFNIMCVDYGKEEQDLPIDDEGVNVVVAHAHFENGFTNFAGAFDLTNHYNWTDCNYVLTGHIHLPTEQVDPITTSRGSCQHLNLGSLCRTTKADRYDQVNYVVMSNEGDQLHLDINKLDLIPYDEVFAKTTKSLDDLVDDVLGGDVVQQRKELTNLLDLISTAGITYGGVDKFIDEIPGVTKEVRTKAHEYLERAKAE